MTRREALESVEVVPASVAEDTYHAAHARIGMLRGMCSDEEPYEAIDAKLVELDALLYARSLVGDKQKEAG